MFFELQQYIFINFFLEHKFCNRLKFNTRDTRLYYGEMLIIYDCYFQVACYFNNKILLKNNENIFNSALIYIYIYIYIYIHTYI